MAILSDLKFNTISIEIPPFSFFAEIKNWSYNSYGSAKDLEKPKQF
jgi:hypothetical protein